MGNETTSADCELIIDKLEEELEEAIDDGRDDEYLIALFRNYVVVRRVLSLRGS